MRPSCTRTAAALLVALAAVRPPPSSSATRSRSPPESSVGRPGRRSWRTPTSWAWVSTGRSPPQPPLHVRHRRQPGRNPLGRDRPRRTGAADRRPTDYAVPPSLAFFNFPAIQGLDPRQPFTFPFNPFGGSVLDSATFVQLTPVPEPAALLLVAATAVRDHAPPWAGCGGGGPAGAVAPRPGNWRKRIAGSSPYTGRLIGLTRRTRRRGAPHPRTVPRPGTSPARPPR